MTDGRTVPRRQPFGHRPWITEPLRLFAYRLAGASHHAAEELDPPGDQLLSQVQGGVDDVLAPRLIGEVSTHLIDELADGFDGLLTACLDRFEHHVRQFGPA